jgi:outer membrane protein OmpA-like peptidoglycan-associated protein
MQTHRFEGWLAGVGVSYGYRWNFRDPRWALEATVGMGYAYLNYNRFECEKCGLVLGPGKKNYFGPTKAGLILILNLGGKPKSDDSFVGVYVPQSHEVATPQPAPKSEARPEAKPLVQAAPESVPAVPTVRREKMHSASGEAYLDFFAGRSEIVSNFRDNAAELQKIDSLIGSILADPSAEITAIIITGHASPEGNPAENLALSKRRADALRNRIGSVHGLPNRLFSVYSTGDDWDRLDTLIEGSDLPQKERLLEILRSDDAGDIRERKLRMINGGASYGLLLDRIYPKLRRTDYRIYYSVREE